MGAGSVFVGGWLVVHLSTISGALIQRLLITVYPILKMVAIESYDHTIGYGNEFE